MTLFRLAAAGRTRRVAVSVVAVGGLVLGAGGATFAAAHGHGHAAARPTAASAKHVAAGWTKAHGVYAASHTASRPAAHGVAVRASLVHGTTRSTSSSHRTAGAASVGAVRSLLAGSYVARPHHQSENDPTLECARLPQLSGSAVVGSRLRASEGKWKQHKHVSFKYQWLANGKPIKHATKSTFVTPKSTVGKFVSVKVTAKDAKKKYDSSFAVSKGVKVVLPQLRSAGKPKITGGAHPSVGHKLTVGATHWSVKNPKLSYVWIDVDRGKVIKGATKSTFVPTKKQLGDRLVVAVTASRPGYRNVVVGSQTTGKVTR